MMRIAGYNVEIDAWNWFDTSTTRAFMKKMLFCLLLNFSVLTMLGQDSPEGAGQNAVDLEAAKKPDTVEKPAEITPPAPPQPEGKVLGRKVIYGGYLTDFLRAERKRPLFSLRAPADPVRDRANLIFDHSATNRIRGIALFSIRF
jgi:hypothetical protein